MAQNSEQIEAKLCAYLEGELDESGRAEIEKHLQQNPAHRKLLAEVGKTRDLIRALPREPAPPDICEAFQGQLERSALLGDLNDDPAGIASMKINRWPQYFAVAAVVVLAAGLGMVVYFGLPSGAPQRHYAVGGGGAEPASAPAEDGVARRTVTPETALSAAPEARADAPVKDLVAAATTPTEFDQGVDRDKLRESVALRGTSGAPAMPGGLAGAEPKQLLKRAETSAPSTQPTHDLPALAKRVQTAWQPEERERLFRSTSSVGAPSGPDATGDATREALASVSPNALCFVVSSARPSATSDEIARQLTRMEVAWAALPQPDATALGAKFELTMPTADAPPAAQLETGDVAEVQQQSGAAAADRAASFKREANAVVGQKKDAYAAGVAAPAPAPAQAPASAPARGPVAQAEQEIAARSDGAATTDAPRPPAAARGYGFSENAAARPLTLFVARGLTRDQAQAINVSLNGAAAERQVTVHAAAPAAQLSAQVPAQVQSPSENLALRPTAGAEKPDANELSADDVPIRRGDALRLVRAQTSGEQTVAQLQVRPDGFATIPGVGDYRCEGLTVKELQDRLKTNLGAAAADPAGAVIQVSKVQDKAKDALGRSPADANEVRANDEVALRDASADRTLRGAGVLRQRVSPAPSPAGGAGGGGPRRALSTRPEPPAIRAAKQSTETPAPAESEATRGGAAAAPAPAPVDAPAEPQEQKSAAVGNAVGDVGKNRATSGPQPTTSTLATTEPAGAADRFDVVILVQAPPEAPDAADSPAPVDAQPSQQGPIQKYDILMVQVGEDENGLTSVRVGEDGTVELPNIGAIKAEGLRPAELQDQIAQKLRPDAGKLQDADRPQDAKVAVKRITPTDGTAPAPADNPKPPAEPQKTDAPAAQPAPSAETSPPRGDQ